MNMGSMMKMAQAWQQFSGNHPKFAAFLKALSKKGMPEGTVCEISITYPDGQKMESSIRIQQSDLDLVNSLKDLGNAQ